MTIKRTEGQTIEYLLGRLRKGHDWLGKHHLALMNQPKLHGPGEEEFLDNLDLWDGMDSLLRTCYDFQGCVTEEGTCPSWSPVSCRGCTKEEKHG